MKNYQMLVASVLVATISALSFQPLAGAETHQADTGMNKFSEDVSADYQAEEIAKALAFIDEIPDELVASSTDEELVQFIQNNQLVPGLMTRVSVVDCSGAIATVIAGTAFPAFKLAKIVRIVKKLGGPRQAAERIKQIGGLQKVIGKHANENNTTGLLASLAAEITGYASIRNNCFS